jgi:hypothetical protein
MRDAVASPQRPLTETRMRKAAITLVGALLIAGSAAQVATASEHHARTGQNHHRWDRSYNQLREPSSAAPQIYEGYNYGKPPANESRTCDSYWCYPN